MASFDLAAAKEISIHALRKESDTAGCGALPFLHISIHALRKESDGWRTSLFRRPLTFQSTLSVRRATL